MITTHPATADRWDDVAAVMGTRGDPAGCWCQFFRVRGVEAKRLTSAEARERLRGQLINDPVPPGVLAYDDAEPVGWCAVAPKSAYPRILASPVSRGDPSEDTDRIWSVSCFVVRVGNRRRGVSAVLLEGALELAREHGAAAVEAYPVDPNARRSVSSAELYHGVLSVFERAGFTVVSRPSAGRAVVRRQV